MIEVSNFHKDYRDVTAVEDLTFSVAPGEVLGLVGPNGAGKTTTLRALSGIIPPSRGRLSIGGFDIVEAPVEAKRRLAYIPDEPKLFDSLTIWEHLEFAASAYEVKNFAERAEALLDAFQLSDKRSTLAQELSRGMRQKTAVCCAYLHDPTAILFDEPMVGLDPRGMRTIKDSIRERSDAGSAIIISSHMLALVEDLCTHLLILHRGKRLFLGSVDEARETYGNLEEEGSIEDVFFRATEGRES